MTPNSDFQSSLEACIALLEELARNPDKWSAVSPADRARLLAAAGRAIHPDTLAERNLARAKRRERKLELESRDRELRASTEIRSVRKEAVFVAPAQQLRIESDQSAEESPELGRARNCYVCKASFRTVHFFYDSMCGPCAELNYSKRFQTASLVGRVALITGARLKIGYQSALLMLRAGARVIVTTRFPQDAALRFAREPDYAEWGARVQVYGLDLRHSPSVEAFTREMENRLDRLDILINNAAQTVRRPPGFYAHLMERERLAHHELPKDAQAILLGNHELTRSLGGEAPSDTRWVSQWHQGADVLGITHSAALSQIPYRCDESDQSQYFPEGKLDADLQQVDQRKMNSWRMKLADVPTAELLEVQLVNSIAPFILCSRLKPLMERDRTDEKHIVNVSAMEGKFTRFTKTDRHPHTNMAKAALNMMTLTSASDYAKSGIFMNAVDTGWVTDEDPAEISSRKQAEHDFQPPLDIVDGAARVCDPFFSGLITGQHVWGKFLKDYLPTSW